ncbi:hypothetical protein B0J14DRAFT_496712, partial [Halenospora varia]
HYYFATLRLFGPFIKLRLLGSTVLPYEICVQAADAITSLLGSYRRLYSLRGTPCFVPIITLASNIMHIVQADSLGIPTPLALYDIANLQEITFSHSFAARGVKILYSIAQRRNLAVEIASGETRIADKGGES